MKDNKIALTIDIEDWYHTPAITGSNFSIYPDVPSFMKSWENKYDYLTKPLYYTLDLLNQLKLKSTFFIVADVIDYYPKLVELIARDGHEIGCHGLHHAAKIHTKTKLSKFTPVEFEDRTSMAREKLSKLSGQPIYGYRAPGGYIAEWMFKSLQGLGFKYDSSVNSNSFFNKTDFTTKNINSSPYWIKIGKDGKRLLEMPWPFLKIGPIRFPTAGGPFLRLFGSNYIIKGLKQSISRGNSIFYFHSIDLSTEPFPQVVKKNKKRPFYWIIKGERVQIYLKKILEEFENSWATCHDIYKTMSL